MLQTPYFALVEGIAGIVATSQRYAISFRLKP